MDASNGADVTIVIKSGAVEYHVNPKKDYHDDPKDLWTFQEDGTLRISGRGYGYVATRDSYRDYRLVLEFRWGSKTWGERENAAKAFEAVIAADANCIDALRGLAALAVEKEDLDRALDLQARLIEIGERTPELFYNTGLLLQKSGQVEDAVRLYQEALAERPNFPEALLNLGHALKSQGKPDEAREFWRQALEQKPELAAGYFGQ